MLSYDPCDPYRGFFLDTYKLPSGCSCHIPDGPAPIAVAAPVVPEAARSAAAAPIAPAVPVAKAAASEPKPLVGHMWLMGCPNPYELQQKWECIFLKVFSCTKIMWASKNLLTCRIQNYQLRKANSALMGHIGDVA